MQKNIPKSSYALHTPKILLEDIMTLEVSFISFEGQSKTGHIEIHRSIEHDIHDFFKLARELSFPLESVIPLKHFHNDDDASMEKNNSSAFCFRTVALKPQELSNHSFGMALDINPLQNPYISSEGRVLPPNARYDRKAAGTLFSDHPLVLFMKKRGFVWGGDWEKPYYDYQHFHKELDPSFQKKYASEIKKTLTTLL